MNLINHKSLDQLQKTYHVKSYIFPTDVCVWQCLHAEFSNNKKSHHTSKRNEGGFHLHLLIFPFVYPFYTIYID